MPRPRGRPPADAETIELITALLAQPDITYDEIEAATGAGRGTISRIAQETDQGRRRGPKDTPLREKARALRVRGLTLGAIGAELGISKQRVSKLLQDD